MIIDSLDTLGYNLARLSVFSNTAVRETQMPSHNPPHTPTSRASQRDEEGRILHASLLISGATFTSRILGFIRDIVLARLFGAGVAADAFYVAYRIPSMLRELVAEGSMAAAFIPTFSEYVHRRTVREAKELANATFTVLLTTLIGVSLLGIIGAPVLVQVIAMGYTQAPEKYALTVALTQMMFPYLIFIGLAALTMGILNTTGAFTAPAFAPALSNIVILTIAVTLAPTLDQPIHGIAIGVVLGGLAQFIIQLPSLRRIGFSFSLRWNPGHAGVKRIAHLMLPTVAGLGVTQVNLLVNTILASFLATGSVTYLFYGMRLIQFPLGLIGIAIATAILPSFAASTARDERTNLPERIGFGLRHVFFLMIPATVGLVILREPIVHLFFEHGEFTRTATQGTANAVLFYAAGLWAFGAVRIVVSAFYALQDTRTPVKVAVLALACNIVLALLLIQPLQHGGLAFATSLAAMVNVGALLLLLTRRVGPLPWGALFHSLLRVGCASVIVVVICLGVRGMGIWAADGQWGLKAIGLGAGVLVSMIGYFWIHVLLGSVEVTAFWDACQQKFLDRGRTDSPPREP